MAKIRTFIAVAVSSQVRDRACELIDRLRASGAGVTWVRRENLHLTLKFLGDVLDSELGAVCGAVCEGAARVPSFRAISSGVGAFPDVRRPATVWLGVTQGQLEISALHAAIEAALAPAGYPKDDRPFHPHLTLGRVRRAGRREQQRLSELIQENADFEAGETLVAETLVFSSVLSPSGPTYEVLTRAPLNH